MDQHRVLSVSDSQFSKTIHLRDGYFVVPRARGVRAGDFLIKGRGSLNQKTRDGLVRVSPDYSREEALVLGRERLNLVVREPTTKDDWDAVERLRSYHYRLRPPFGRQGVLLASIDEPQESREVVGLIELGAAPLCNAARDRVLNSPFTEGNVGWERWDFRSRGLHCKRIVSITRVVVEPDFRGIGLSTLLMRHATRYCRDYWQLAGARPLFCEIVADMLRYHSFAASAGFSFAGHTEGNLHRVAKDVRYQLNQLSSEFERDNHGESSVERMQWRYARFLAFQVGQCGRDLGWILKRLETMDGAALLRHLALLQDVVRLPKPVFLTGLTRKSIHFVADRAASNLPQSRRVPSATHKHNLGEYRFERVKVRRRWPISRTERVRQVCLSFGVPYGDMEADVLQLDASIPEGAIVLLSGRSGAGKTTILRLLSGDLRPASGKVERPPHSSVVTSSALPGDRTLVDAVGDNLAGALERLSFVGLSEPSVYLQRYDSLSAGQKERARLAQLLGSRANCWLVDDFGSGLDRHLARIVAHRFAKEARRVGATLFLASTRGSELMDVLRPDYSIEVGSRRAALVVARSDTCGAPVNQPERAPASPMSLAQG